MENSVATLGSVVAHAQVLSGSSGVSLLRGGSGIALAGLAFRRIDGGSGQDMLRLGSGLALDLTEQTGRAGRGVQNMELFHLEASSSHLRLDLSVFYALGERDSNGDYALRVTGHGRVGLVDRASWDYTDTPPEENVYSLGEAVLYVEDGVSVS